MILRFCRRGVGQPTERSEQRAGPMLARDRFTIEGYSKGGLETIAYLFIAMIRCHIAWFTFLQLGAIHKFC